MSEDNIIENIKIRHFRKSFFIGMMVFLTILIFYGVYYFLYVRSCQNDILNLLRSQKWVRYAENPILTPRSREWDCRALRDPFVLKQDNKYLMFYYGYAGEPPAIGLAISEDGRSFFRYGTKPLLSVGAQGEWDSAFVQFGSIIKYNEHYLMYYTGCREAAKPENGYDWCGIGIAESPDLYHWTKYPENPIWNVQGDLRFTLEYLPFVIFNEKDNKYYLYAEKSNPIGIGGWVIDMAISENPYIFSDFKTIWKGAQDLGIDLAGAANPKVFKIQGTFLMGYNGFDEGNPGNLRLAISQDGVNWLPFNNGKALLQKQEGKWDSYRAENNFLLFDENEIKLYYFASPAESQKYHWKIGTAYLPKCNRWLSHFFPH